MLDVLLSPTDFVALVNQTLEFAYPSVKIVGEVANFKVSKNRWVYFDLKDEFSSVRFFGTVYNLPGPLEDGLTIEVLGQPRLSPKYGFSVTFNFIKPVGEGSIKKASDLLHQKLLMEGLFDEARKRRLPYPPTRIGLITSNEAAAYADFNKILNTRWGGVAIEFADVSVQGEMAVESILGAIEKLNALKNIEAIVITRGGGSLDDLAVFNNEQIVRAVALSRVPVAAAIGHESDISLVELAADLRASTPSNLAELLVPDKTDEAKKLKTEQQHLTSLFEKLFDKESSFIKAEATTLKNLAFGHIEQAMQSLIAKSHLLEALSPNSALKRGYSIIRRGSSVVKSVKQLDKGAEIKLILHDGNASAIVKGVENVS